MKNSLYLRSGLLALVLLAAIPAALGATSITGPTVISSPGTYVLTQDIAGGQSPAIWVQSSGVTIDGNGHTIRGAGGSYGILVNKDGTTLTGVTVKNVRLEHWNCGLYFKGVANSQATGVTAASNGKAGINLRSTSGTTVSGCTVTGNEQGILLWQNTDGNTISGNTATDNDDAGIYVASTGRSGSGIVFDSTGNTISGNTVRGNGQGIYLDFTRDNQVTGNTVTNNDDYGIFLDYSSGTRLSGNTVSGHAQSGFVLFDSGGCSISGNTATGNDDYDLWAIDSASLSIGSNQFSGNGDGAQTLSGGSTQSSGVSTEPSSGSTEPSISTNQYSGNSDETQTPSGGSTQPTTVVTTTTTTQQPSGSADLAVAPATATKGAAVKFTVTPTAGKTIKSVWWSFDADKHLNTWNSWDTCPAFFYPDTGTYSPLVKITYTDNSVEEVKKPQSVTIT